jgi:hypothetical protein
MITSRSFIRDDVKAREGHPLTEEETDMTNEANTAATSNATQADAGATAAIASLVNQMKLLENQINTLTTRRSSVTESEHYTEDVGLGENLSRSLVNDGDSWAANKKRTYDEFQDLALNHARMNQEYLSRSRDHYDRLVSNSLDHVKDVQHLALQSLRGSHNEHNIAVDREWNVDEVAELVAKTPVFQDAIAGAVAAGVAKAIDAAKSAA